MNVTINRSVLIIVPKKPFYDWGNRLTPEHQVDKYDECESYLLDNDWNSDEAEEFLKINYDQFFQDQLHGAWTNEPDWPQNRNWKMFQEWFDWHYSSMVWDIFHEKGIKWKEWH